MSLPIIEEQTFQKVDYTTEPLPKAKYEYCSFQSCDFSDSDLSEIKFLETTFTDCNFSNANILKAYFQDISFKNCKLLGLHFETCTPFGFAIQFDHSMVNHASFYQMDLQNCSFKHCQLKGVDFTEADLTGIALIHCNLLDATFERSVLTKADFRNATDYSIDPNQNKIRGAQFSLPEVIGLLKIFGIKVDA